ncbi:MAG: calcineurin-like phosphoesterase family protein, partial [Bacteroidales bacterium]|nr:calcineurin-like phosphoesterase family protein [Bacteroidales bacterium]
MKKYVLICMCALWGASSIWGQTAVTGYVYEDLNRNGKKDRSEKGIAQTAVSNGTEVCLTDAQGKYQLPVGDDNIIFVIKPAGYQAPLNEYNLPKTYYIHKPKGSPALRYEGVKPTGTLPKSVDFALYRYPEAESFVAFVFGDTQPYTDKEIAYLKDGIVTEAANYANGISFGITLGDLVGDTLDLHLPYREMMQQIGLPWYNVLGNHDMNYDVKADSLSDENFELYFGPANYAFNYGRAHFIVLDDVLYPHPLTGRGYWGGLREDQWTFIENDLRHVSSDRLIVISMHIPLADVEDNAAFRNSDRQRFHRLLKPYPNVLFLSAHTHIQTQGFYNGKEHDVDRNIPIREYNVGTTCGDWFSGIVNENGIPVSTMRDGTPPGYALLRIDGNRYTIDYKVFGKPLNYQIAVYNPKVVPARRSTSAAIYANFFMGSKRDTVEYRIDNGDWAKMNRVDEFDPAYYRYVQDWDYVERLPAGRRPSNPIPCSHLWKGGIDTRLPAGTHRIEVRAKDLHGRTFTA